MLKKLLLAVLLVAVFLAQQGEAAVCVVKKKATERVGVCDVKFTVSGCLKNVIKWRYKADAEELSTGLKGHHEWSKSGNGAAEAAANVLFSNHPQLVPKCYPNGLVDISLEQMVWE